MMETDTMPGTHVVEEVVLDITFGAEEEAFAEQASLSTFMKSDMLSVVETVFQEWGDSDDMLTVDRLEVDLGTMPYEGYQAEMLHRLRERLPELLQEHVRARHGRLDRLDVPKTKQESDGHLVKYLLRHGRLPWNAPMAHENVLEHLFPSVLMNQWENVVEFLRTGAHRALAVKRLLRQLSASMLQVFLQRLAPNQHWEVSQWVAEIRQVFGAPPFDRLARRTLEEELWEVVIHIFLSKGHESGDWKEGLLFTIKRIGHRHGLTDSQMEQWFRLRVEVLEAQGGRPLKLTTRLPPSHPLEVAVPLQSAGPLSDSPGKATSETKDFPQHRHHIDARFAAFDLSAYRDSILTSIRQGEVEPLAAHWYWLSRHHAEFLKDLFREVGRQAVVRRRLAANMPETMLEHMALLFVPKWAVSLAESHRILGLLWAKNHDASFTPESTRQILWMGTLAYLFLTPVHRLERTAHLQFMISYLIKQDRKWLTLIQGALDHILSELKAPAEVQQEILRSLEIHSLTLFAGKEDQGTVGAAQKTFVRAYDLYEKLRESFVWARSFTAETEKQWFSMVEELFVNHPEQIVRLYRDLQSGELVYESVPTPLTSKQLRRLVQIFIEMAPPAMAGRKYSTSSELFRALETHADHASDSKHLYEQVLRTLASGDPLVLDVLGATRQGELHAKDRPAQVDFFRERVATCLVSVCQSTNESPSELGQRIEFEARRASDALEFYMRLLDRLLSHTAIDFEELVPKASRQVSSWEVMPARDSDPTAQKSQGSDTPELLEHETALPWLTREEAGSSEHTQDPASVMGSRERFCQYIKGDLRVPSYEAAPLRICLEEWMAARPDQVRRFCCEALEDPRAVARMVHVLPERLLVRVLALVVPHEYERMLLYAGGLVDACSLMQAEPFLRMRIRKIHWQCLFTYVLAEGRNFDDEDFIEFFAESLGRHLGLMQLDNWREQVCSHLMAKRFSFNEWVQANIVKVLSRPASELSHRQPGERSQSDEGTPSAVERSPAPTASSGLEGRFEAAGYPKGPPQSPAGTGPHLRAKSKGGIEDDRHSIPITEAMYVTNAGLVLGGPYFPRLFSMLDLTSQGRFVDQEAAERAVHLLQFMVNERTDLPEHHLLLNKLLCGIDLVVPIRREIRIEDREKECIEGLLRSMIHHWSRLGQTSVSGFRESFLQREGKIQLQHDAWHLVVEERAFDMLLDHVPWSFSPIKFPWMERVLYVEWR